MTTNKSVQEVLDSIRRDYQPTQWRCFWVVTQNRQNWIDQWNAQSRSDDAAIVRRVQGRRFQIPNCLSQDIVEEIREAKAEIDTIAPEVIARGRLNVVLVSLSKMEIPNASSPATLPAWFPTRPGMVTEFQFVSVFDHQVPANDNVLAFRARAFGGKAMLSKLFLGAAITSSGLLNMAKGITGVPLLTYSLLVALGMTAFSIGIGFDGNGDVESPRSPALSVFGMLTTIATIVCAWTWPSF